MDGFWSALWQAIINKAVWAWAIAGFLSGAIGLVLDFTLWRKPRWENRLKWLKAIPFIVFGMLLLFCIIIAMPYNVWQNGQTQLLNEKQEAKNIMSELQKQNNEIQRELDNLKEHLPSELIVTSSVGKRPEVYNPTSADVVITVRMKPPYLNMITQTVLNPNPKYYLYEVIKFKTSEGFKFWPLPTDLKLPEYFIIQEGYEDTDNMIVIVKDYPPLASFDLPLEVYTSDLKYKGTENVTMEILAKGIEKTLE